MSSVQIFRKLQQQPVINYTQRWCSKFNAITRGEQDSDCKVGEVTYLPDMTRPFEFCVPTTATKVPASPDWLHEVKYDGYRLRLERDGDRVRLITRGGYNWTKRFPWIAEAALKNRQKQFVIDGEAVILGVGLGISRLKPGRNILMLRRSIVSLAATVMIGSACLVTISNDATAYSSSGIAIWQPGVYRGAGYRGAYYRGACYRGAVGAAAVRAYYARRC